MRDVAALALTCQYFQLSRDAEMTQIRKQKQRLSSENYRLGRQVERLREHLELERSLARRLQLILCRTSGRLEGLSVAISGLFS